MAMETLLSYAQNGEDVVLLRALGGVRNGRYVDVGACDPVEHSVTLALYERGWRGIDIDAVPAYAEKFRVARPGNEVVQAAISDSSEPEMTFHELVGTGLSTLIGETALAHEAAGFELRDITVPVRSLNQVCEESALLGGDLHLLKVDVEGAEAQVLRSFDLRRWMPWVVVVEATQPLSTKPSYEEWDPILTDAGYTLSLFDGLSRFYVAAAHLDLLAPLSYPACVLDDFMTLRTHQQLVSINELTAELAVVRRDVDQAATQTLAWRNRAVEFWAESVAKSQASDAAAATSATEAQRLRRQLTRARANLEQARDERDRLRRKVKSLRTRLQESQQPAGRQGITARIRPLGRLRGVTDRRGIR